jgi:ATPase involved in DNA replication initiation
MSKSPDQLSLNIKLDDTVSLDRFIECDSNRDCLNFLKSTLREDSISNLFYIWGREGVGKSYIMQALNREFINQNKRTFHLSLTDRKVSSHKILQHLEALDVILIENIDNLPKSEEWETQIFSLINSALTSKIKIYLSSRIVSKDLEIDLKDLHSRLAYFTAIEVPEITNEEKLDAI